MDRKGKRVNFLITLETNDFEEKASADSVEGIMEMIDSLQVRLDKI